MHHLQDKKTISNGSLEWGHTGLPEELHLAPSFLMNKWDAGEVPKEWGNGMAGSPEKNFLKPFQGQLDNIITLPLCMSLSNELGKPAFFCT